MRLMMVKRSRTQKDAATHPCSTVPPLRVASARRLSSHGSEVAALALPEAAMRNSQSRRPNDPGTRPAWGYCDVSM
jgi:hypothetical protein